MPYRQSRKRVLTRSAEVNDLIREFHRQCTDNHRCHYAEADGHHQNLVGAGHASRIASFVRESCVCSVFIAMLPITFSWIFPVSDSHNALLHS